MSITEQLEKKEKFSASEKQLADYILSNKEKVLSMSVQELSKVTYTSTSSVVGLCKKIGLYGFKDFKIQFAAELQRSVDNFEQMVDGSFPLKKNDSFFEITKNIYNLKMNALNDIYQRASHHDYKVAVDLMRKAHTIGIVASGDNYIRAMDFQNKMMKIGKHVLLSPVQSEHDHTFFALDKTDCGIIISYSGESRHLYKSAETLDMLKIPYIVITANKQSTIAKNATVVLENTSIESASIKYSTFASSESTQYILDVLYSYFFVSDFDKHSKHRIQVETYLLDGRKQG